MRYIQQVTNMSALGTVGVAAALVLTGCSQSSNQQEDSNYFLVVEQLDSGKYVVVEKMPTDGPSRAIIREKDASGQVVERFMNEQQMKEMAEQEYAKMQAGQSELNETPSSEPGMGIASTILAVAAGALLGNMIGNALSKNQNFNKHSQRANNSAKMRSASGGKTAKANNKKSFFGNSNNRATGTRGGRFGG